MAFAGRVNLTNGTYTDLFSGIANTGVYEVIVTSAGGSTHLVSSNSATEGVDNLAFSTSFPGPLRFTWDSSQPLYAYASSTSQFIKYILTPVTSVGLSVNCS